MSEVFTDVAKTKQLFKLITKDRTGMPDFSESQKFEVLTNAACQLGIAPRLKIQDLRNGSRDAELYLLTEVYSHDLPEDTVKYVNETLEKHGQTLKIRKISDLEQPETLVQVLNVLDPGVKLGQGLTAMQQLQKHIRNLKLSSFAAPDRLDEQQVRVILRACK